jgi:DNA-binding transcriptional regulator YhcF (GntR family)
MPLQDIYGSQTTCLVYAWCLGSMDDNNEIRLSTRAAAEEINLSHMTVSRSIRKLADAQLVETSGTPRSPILTILNVTKVVTNFSGTSPVIDAASEKTKQKNVTTSVTNSVTNVTNSSPVIDAASGNMKAKNATTPVTNSETCPFDRIVGMWNATLGMNSRLTENRKRQLCVRWKDEWWRGNWQHALEAVNDEDNLFLRGGGSRGWHITLEFFLRPDTATNILEGKYHGLCEDTRSNGQKRLFRTLDAFDSVLGTGSDRVPDSRSNVIEGFCTDEPSF